MKQDVDETRWEQDETRKNRRWWWDEIQQDAFYNNEALMRWKYIWVTFKSDLDEMSESDLDKIWVRFELS